VTDKRRYPANDRVAHESLRGRIEGVEYVAGTKAGIAAPVADIRDAPGGSLQRQLIYGQEVAVLESRDEWAFAQSRYDGYVGYLATQDLGPWHEPTHRVTARATHLYEAPHFKRPARDSLSFGSGLRVTGQSGAFAETPGGFVPLAHVETLDAPFSDPVSVAVRLLGTPYLWGGNSSFGIDCSGLIQIACAACGLNCPGDSDMQQAELGTPLPEEAALTRGDLLFWRGHVAWVEDADTLIHANQHRMAVTREPLQTAIARIADQGDGPVTARKRLGDHR